MQDACMDRQREINRAQIELRGDRMCVALDERIIDKQFERRKPLIQYLIEASNWITVARSSQQS